jgi:hypothetical protein
MQVAYEGTALLPVATPLSHGIMHGMHRAVTLSLRRPQSSSLWGTSDHDIEAAWR